MKLAPGKSGTEGDRVTRFCCCINKGSKIKENLLCSM